MTETFDLISALLVLAAIMAIFPMAAFGIGSNPDSDPDFVMFFKQPDSEVIFTDAKLVEMRALYEPEYKKRRLHAIAYSIIFVALFIAPANTELGLDENMETLAGVLFGIIYIVTSILIFGRLGASHGRYEATQPIGQASRSALERIIKDSTNPDELVKMVNRNPKETLARIDVSNIKYQAARMKEAEENKPLEGLRK